MPSAAYNKFPDPEKQSAILSVKMVIFPTITVNPFYKISDSMLFIKYITHM